MADEQTTKPLPVENALEGISSMLNRFRGFRKKQEPSPEPSLPEQPQSEPSKEALDEQATPYLLFKQMASWIDRGFTLNAVLDNLLRGLIRTLDLDYAAYFVINPLDDKAQLRMQFAAPGLSPRVTTGFSVPLTNESIIGWVYNQKHEHILANTRESRFTNNQWLLPGTTCQALFPILVNNQVIAFMDVQAHRSDAFDSSTLEFLHALTIYLRGVLAQSETALLPAIKPSPNQVDQLIRQAHNDVELFSLLRSTLTDSPFVAVLFSVQYDHLALQFITDAKRPAVASSIQGLALPLENTLQQLASGEPIIIENLETQGSDGQILSFFKRRSCTSAAIFGIFENNAITYILAIGGFAETPINAENIASLLELTKSTGVALQDLHLISKLKSRLSELEALSTVSKATSVQTDLKNLFVLLNEQVIELIGSDVSFAVTIYNPAQDHIEIPFMTEDGQLVNFPPFPLGEGLTSVVIRTQKPLLLHNQQQINALSPKIVGKAVHSWLGVPLLIGSDILGTMMVQDTDHEDRFSETDLNILQTLAPQVAVAIRNAQLFDQVENVIAQHKLLHQISIDTAAATGISEAIQTTVDLLSNALPNSRIIVLLKDNHDMLTVHASAGFSLEAVVDLSIPIGQGIIGLAAESATSQIVNDVRTEPSYINLDPEIQSEMAIPITFKGEVLGILDIELPIKNAFLSSEAEIFGTLGNNLGAVIASARLVEDSRIQVANQQKLFEATSKIRRSVDMQSIMELSATEIGRILGARRVSIQVNPQYALNNPTEPGDSTPLQPALEVEQ